MTLAAKLQLLPMSMDQNLATRKRHNRFCVFQRFQFWQSGGSMGQSFWGSFRCFERVQYEYIGLQPDHEVHQRGHVQTNYRKCWKWASVDLSTIPLFMADFQLSSLFLHCFAAISHHSKWYTDSQLTDSAPGFFFSNCRAGVSRDGGKVSCLFSNLTLSKPFFANLFCAGSGFSCWDILLLVVRDVQMTNTANKMGSFLRPLFSWWRRYRVTSH